MLLKVSHGEKPKAAKRGKDEVLEQVLLGPLKAGD